MKEVNHEKMVFVPISCLRHSFMCIRLCDNIFFSTERLKNPIENSNPLSLACFNTSARLYNSTWASWDGFQRISGSSGRWGIYCMLHGDNCAPPSSLNPVFLHILPNWPKSKYVKSAVNSPSSRCTNGCTDVCRRIPVTLKETWKPGDSEWSSAAVRSLFFLLCLSRFICNRHST